jgi:hypothetical protein
MALPLRRATKLLSAGCCNEQDKLPRVVQAAAYHQADAKSGIFHAPKNAASFRWCMRARTDNSSIRRGADVAKHGVFCRSLPIHDQMIVFPEEYVTRERLLMILVTLRPFSLR